MTVNELRDKLDKLSKEGKGDRPVVGTFLDGTGWPISPVLRQGNVKNLPEAEVVALVMEVD